MYYAITSWWNVLCLSEESNYRNHTVKCTLRNKAHSVLSIGLSAVLQPIRLKRKEHSIGNVALQSEAFEDFLNICKGTMHLMEEIWYRESYNWSRGYNFDVIFDIYACHPSLCADHNRAVHILRFLYW